MKLNGLTFTLSVLLVASAHAGDTYVCPPQSIAPDDRESTLQNRRVEIDVLANDGVSQLGPIRFTEVPSHGTVQTTVGPNGEMNVVYAPNHNFVGTDRFSYSSQGKKAKVLIDVEKTSSNLLFHPRTTVLPRGTKVLVGSNTPALFWDVRVPGELQVYWDGNFRRLKLPDGVDRVDYVREANSARHGNKLYLSFGDVQTHSATDAPEIPAYFLVYDMSGAEPVLIERRFAGNDRARAPRLLLLKDSSVVFLWEELPVSGTDLRTRFGIDYYRADGSWAPTLLVAVDHATTPLIESNYTLVQHPATGEIWIFTIADAVSDIAVINLSSDGVKLSLNWQDDQYIDFPGECIEPDGELPWLDTAVHDKAIFLGYQNQHRGTQFWFSSGPQNLFRAQSLTVVEIDAAGNREFFNLPVRVERAADVWAIEEIDGFVTIGFKTFLNGDWLDVTTRAGGRIHEPLTVVGGPRGQTLTPIVAGDDTFVVTTFSDIRFVHLDVYDKTADDDRDGLMNQVDNCIAKPNPDQRDIDSDGFGNICDPDLDNNGIVNAVDLRLMESVHRTADAVADLNGDHRVNAVDLAILRSFLGFSPGPSGLARTPAQRSPAAH